MRPHSFFFHPIIKSSTTREPSTASPSFASLRPLRVTEPRLRAGRGRDRDEGMIFFRLRRGIEQRNGAKKEGICQIEHKTDRQTGRMERKGLSKGRKALSSFSI